MTKTNPPWLRRHPWPWRATAGAALVALAAWAAPQAHAQVTLLDVANGTDGTEGFDVAQSGPGYDAGPTNKIVRTNDEFTYQMTFRTGALGDTNVKLTSKLPAGGHSEWTGVPGSCDGAGSEVSADGQTLTCVVANVTPNTTQTIIFTGLVRGTTPNNTALTPPVTALTSGSVATALSPNSNAENLTVTAAPFYDVVVQMSYQGNPRGYGWRTENGPAGEDGAYHRPMVGLVARHPNGHGRKGVEQLNSDPVEIKVDLAYPAGVRLDTWHDGTAPHGTPAATGGFATGCGSPWAGNPSYESGSSINTFDRVRDTGGASTAASVVPNGGTCGIVSATEQQITLSLTGVDTSLKRRPTLKGGDFTVPDTEWWVSNKALVLWTPLSSYPADGTALTHTIKFNSIKAKSISGQAVPVPANPPQGGQKEASYEMQNTTSGSASKYYTPEAVEVAPAPRPAPFATVEDPGVNGDRHVNHMAKAQVVSSRVVYNNLGATDHFDVYLCEIIDRTAFDLDPVVFGVRSYGQVNTVKYGSRNAGKFFPSTGTATGEYAGSSIGTSAYGTAKCNDPGITWHATKEAAEQNGGLVYVRADIPRMRAGESHYLYVRGLVLRETWAETIDVEGGSQRVKDAPIPAGAVIRNRGDVSSGSANLAWIDDAMLRDHLVVVPSRTISRVKKTVASPANTDTTPVSAGSTVRYRLEPRFATTFPPLKANFTVTDVLPPGLTYQPSSATVAPTVAANTPEAGYTTLTWDLGEKTPYLGPDGDAGAQLDAIEFDAVVDLDVANDSSLRNHVAVHGGINDYEAACTFSAVNGFGDCAKASVADIRVRTAPGFRIEKRTTTPAITAGEDFQYELKYTALVDVSAPDIPHWIDILPYVGDSALSRSPGSTFDAGAYALKGVVKPTDDAAAQIYYTNRTPAQVENDPRHASNGSGGATKWCLETAFGSAGCPANMAAVTAVRIQPGVSTLAGGKGYAVLLNFSTDANIAKGGDIFNNSVGGHSPDPASSLQYVYAQSQQPVRIAGNSLAGHVYEDTNDNGQLEGGEAGIANNTITLYGCVAGANGTVDTTAMNMTTLPPSCTGDDQLVTRTATSGATDGAFAFQGLADGLYSLVQLTQPAGYNDGKTTAGNGGGTASAQGTLPSSIVNIPLTNNGAGKNYNFGELKPVAPTIKAIDDDYGNKPNNVVQTLPSVLIGPGSTPDKANGANAATGPTGNVDLTPGALSHAPATGSISMNADGVITIAAGTTPGSYTYGYTICLKAPHQLTCSNATAKVTVTGGAQPTPAIAAVNDDYGTVVNDQVHTLVTVLQGPGTTPDTANGVPATPANVTLTPGTLSATPADGGITMDANGVITVKSTTTPGTYTYSYKICLKAPNADTCASAEAKVKVIAGPPAPPGRSNVSLVKTVDNPGAAIGTEVTFTVKVQNRGPENAANVQVQEQLPAGFALVSANPSVGSYSAPTWTIGALANGASATLTIKAKVNATGPYANTATVSTTTPDYSAGDDSDTATVVPSAPAAIDAIDDDYGVKENNKLHTLPSVLTGPGSTPDMVGGVAAAASDVTLTAGAPSTVPAAGYIAMDSDGVIIIAAGTTPGEYTFTYKICLKAPNDTVCDTAVAKVRVTAASGTEPSIDAIDDDYGAKPNNVAHTLPSVLVGPVSTPDKADAGVNATLANVTLTPGAPSVMPANGAIAMNGNGEITIAAGTTPDDYQFVYTICLKAPHDTVCDIAIAKVKVQAATGPAPTVDAIDDNYGIKINNVAHTLPSVLVGPNGTTPDQANGVNASLVNVTLTPGTLSALPATGSIVMDTSGTLTIAAGTTPGDYEYSYKICLKAPNDTVCDTALAKVKVVNPVPPPPPPPPPPTAHIDAVNDSFGTVPGDKPTTTPSVLVGDTANGQPATGSNVTLTPGKLSQQPAKGSIKMNPDGTLTIAAGTTPGDYEYSYKICLKAPNDTVCDEAVAKVTVGTPSTPVIDAVNDSFGTVPGDKPTTTPSVLVGDTANGQPATGSNVTLMPGKLSQQPAKGSIKMNPDGTLTIAAGTTPGDYEYSYKICLKAPNDTVCDEAVAKVTVGAVTLIHATDDEMKPIAGKEGGKTPSVLGDNGGGLDTAVGGPADASNVKLIPGQAPQPAEGAITMDADGTITVTPGTTPGTYTYPYTICLVAASTVCDSATATVVVAGVTDMGVLKTVEPGVVAAGDKVTFTITVKNHGPSDALDVQVTEALPSGYTLVSATPSVGTFAAPIWKVGTLVNGASATLKVVATVNATGDYLNVVTVSTASSDSVHANNQASVMPPSLQQPTPPASAVPVPANAPWAVLLVMLAMWMLAYRARFGRK